MLSLTLAALPALAQEPPGVPPDEGTIRAVVEGFHAALAAGDSTRALEYLHPDLMVYESGHAETLDEYRSGHLASDIEFSRAVSFDTVEDSVVLGRDLSLYLRRYRVRGSFRDTEIDAAGVETMILAPTPTGWKIRHIHWSSR
ncbi:MAG TPA: nuclear transport factor 2 family protein [Gemmatimonadota bacterium]|nr:nuclear transport factor 2 family protein [Gemmatimonadota bacterium]